MQKLDPDTALRILELQQFTAEYFAELDAHHGLNSAAFFTEDGSVDIGNMRFSGHAGITKFYQDLAERVRVQDRGVTRTTRHAYTNMHISFVREDEATVTLLVIEFSGSGEPPLPGATTPTIVSDTRLQCRREVDGQWRIAALSGRPVFSGNDPILNQLLLR